MAKLKWKRGEAFGRECYRLRRGDLTLATVVRDGRGTWYFTGLVPGGSIINTLGQPAPWSGPDVEQVRCAAKEWVKEQLAVVDAAREARA